MLVEGSLAGIREEVWERFVSFFAALGIIRAARETQSCVENLQRCCKEVIVTLYGLCS